MKTAGDVYQFVEELKVASRKNGATELHRQLDDATRVGSSSLEMLGAIRQTVTKNRSEVERLLGPARLQAINQVLAFVDKAFGR